MRIARGGKMRRFLNPLGLICIAAGILFVLFNIPLRAWLILLGLALIGAGIVAFVVFDLAYLFVKRTYMHMFRY